MSILPNTKGKMMHNLLHNYRNALDTNPLRTKMITSFTLFSLGDFLCQGLERKLRAK